MSATEGDASSRLESTLADLFAGMPTLPDRDSSSTRPGAAAASPAADDWDVDGPEEPRNEPRDDASVALPEIVPATSDRPVMPRAAPAAAAPSTAPAPNQATTRHTSWGDHLSQVPAGGQNAGLRAPGRRPRVRRVTRVLRHVDPWSTFKVALLFSVVAYLVALTSGVLLWRVADSTGTLDNVERWFTQFGWETFELKGGEIFHNAWIIGLFGAVALTGGLVLLATLFNLVSDIVGGVRMTVLEEEVVERTVSSTRRYVVRRAPSAGAEDDWDVDDDAAEPVTSAGSAASGVSSSPAGPAGASPRDDWSVDDDDDRDHDRDRDDRGSEL